VIVLRRLGGQTIALNPDLIERVEATPDTVVTMVDEKKFLIDESLEDVLQLITDYRAYVIARSRDLAVTDYNPAGRPVLQVVPDDLVVSPNVDDHQAALEAGEAARVDREENMADVTNLVANLGIKSGSGQDDHSTTGSSAGPDAGSTHDDRDERYL
jgi:flagellar protein FlbD